MASLAEFKSTSIDLDKHYEELEKNRNDISDLEEPPANNGLFNLPSNEQLADNLLRQSQVDGTDPELFAPGTEYGNNLGDLRKTRAYELYAYTDEQKLSQAQKMGKDLNMDPALILYDDETYSKTIDMWNIGRGARSLADEGELFDLAKVYAKHPALKAVAEEDMYAGAEALHNLKATEKLESLAEIIKYASEMNDLTLRAQALSEKYQANKGRSEEIDKEYEAIQAEREKLAKLLPDYGNDLTTRIMAESAVQLPMLYRTMKRSAEGAARGAFVGGIAGATMGGVGAVPGAMTGAVWGARAGMSVGSYEEILPEEVLKLAYDGNNRSFDNIMNTARASAAAQAAIESLSVGRFLKVVGGGKVLSKGASQAAKGIGQATFGLTTKQGLKNLAYGTVRETIGESLEEAEQDFISNSFASISAPDGAKKMTIGEMMASAADNFVQALAPSFGLGLVPGAMSTIPAMRKGAQIAAERGKVNMGVTINTRFGDYVNTALQDKNIMEFFHKSPEAAAAITGKTLEEYGVKNVSIDVAGIMEQENGKQIMEAIAHEEKITADQLEAAISGEDNMQVDVKTFMQVAAQFEGQNITDFANVAGKDAPNLYRMKQVQEALKNIQDFNADKTEETLRNHAEAFYDNYVVEGIEDEQEKIIGRKLINEIASTNPDDFKAGIETVLNGLDADSNERKVLENAAPKLRELAEDYVLTQGLSKEGITVYRNMVDTLQNGSRKVQQSAKASAILVARRAEMFARAMLEMGNKEYTALDYMKRFEVNADAEGRIGTSFAQNEVQNSVITPLEIKEGTMPSFDKLKAFREYVRSHIKRNPTPTKDGSRKNFVGNSALKRTVKGVGRKLDWDKGTKSQRELIAHREAFGDIERMLESCVLGRIVEVDSKHSSKVLGQELYYTVIEYKGNKFAVEVAVDIPISLANTYNYAGHKLEDVTDIKIASLHTRPTAEAGVPTSRDASFAYSLSQLVEIFKQREIKNEGEARLEIPDPYSLNQTAYHGSPYKFDKFDLGAIGTGEGAQAHGWGLYFAQDRSVAASYRNMQSTEIRYKGKDMNELSWQLQRKGEYDKATIVDDFIMATDEAELDYDDYEPATVKWFKTTVLPKVERDSSLFEVDIPEDDVLLDEDKELNDQPETVRKAIYEYYKQHEDDFIVPDDYNNLGHETGGRFLKEVEFQLKREGSETPEKDASLLLNSLGIKGITYEGGRDGRCFVVFDDKAIKIIETYNQAQNSRARGSTSFMPDGKAIINLFTRATKETAPADQSTLPHEFGHMFLRDLQELAEMPNAPEHIVKDWATVKEFLQVEDGKELTRKQHEQFARHFESYLMNGEAPTKSLKNVFRNFKKWLTDIYNDVKTLLSIEGGATQLNPDMKAVFDRMLASDTEIEAAATDHEMLIENLKNIVGSDASVQLVQEWMDDAKAAAKESMLAGLMKDLEFWKGKNPEDVKAAARATAEQNMRDNAWYKVSILADELKIDVVDARNQLGITIEEMREATEFLRKNGYNLDDINDAVNKEAVRIEAMGKGILKTDEEIRQMAEEKLNEHLEEIAVLEDMLLAEHMNDYRRAQGFIAESVKRETAELKGDPKQDKFQQRIEKLKERNQKRIDELKEQNKDKVANLKYEARYLEAERKMLDEIQKAKDAKHVEEIVQKYKNKVYQERWRTAEANLKADTQKGIINQHKEIVRQYRDAVRGMSKEIKNTADTVLSEHRIGEAMDYKMWQRMAERELRTSIQLMSKAITMAGKDIAKSNELMKQAADERRKYSLHLRMANQSQELNRKLLKKSDRMKKRTATMKKGKNVSARCRYVENDLLYLFGFTGKVDENVPVDADVNVLTWNEMVSTFGDEDGNIMLPERVINAIQKHERLMWPEMKLGEYQDVMNLLDFVYELGKIEMGDYDMPFTDNEGKIRKASEAHDIVLNELGGAVETAKGPHDLSQRKTLRESVKALWSKSHAQDRLKFEVILKAIGPRTHSLIYGMRKRASDLEAVKRTESQKRRKEIASNIKDKNDFADNVLVDWGEGNKLTRAELVMIALNYGNEGNAQRLRAGHGVTDEQIVEALSYLKPEDVKFVNEIWEHIDSFWHDTAALAEWETGFAPKKVKAVPFNVRLKDGTVATFKGGYFPIQYNYEKMSVSQTNHFTNMANAGSELNARTATMAQGTRYNSHSKNRVKSVPAGRPLDLDINVIDRVVNEIIHNNTQRKTTLIINRILTSSDVSSALEATFGMDIAKGLVDWNLDAYAPKPSSNTAMVQLMAAIRRNKTAATLGGKWGWSLANIMNIGVIWKRIGFTTEALMYLDAARGKYKGIMDNIENWSPYMAEIKEQRDNNLAEELQRHRQMNLKNEKAKLALTRLLNAESSVKEKMELVNYWLPTAVDRLTTRPYWAYAYRERFNECLEKGMPEHEAHVQAVDAGDRAVREIIGSNRREDLAGVQKSSNEFVRNFSMFYGYFSLVYNTFAEDYYMNKETRTHKADYEKMAKAMTATAFGMIFMDAMYNGLWNTGKDDEDDKKKKLFIERYWEHATGEAVSSFTGMFPYLRSAYRIYAYRKESGKAIATAIPSMAPITKMIDGEASIEEGKALRGIVNIVDGVAQMSGVPTNYVSWVNNLTRAMMDEYTLNEALTASFFDQRLRDKKKKKEIIN